MQRKTKQFIFTSLTLGLMAVIFWFSSAGHEVSSGQSEGIIASVQQLVGVALPETLVRKAAHFTLYFSLGAVLVATLFSYGVPRRRVVLLAVFIAGLYAISDELHQRFVPGRSGQVSDVLLDTAAACVGAVVIWRLHRTETLQK